MVNSLREQLGYDRCGDLGRHADASDHRPVQAGGAPLRLAILAGVDIIAVANNITYSGTVADRFINKVHQMLEAGGWRDRIEQSFGRIMQLTESWSEPRFVGLKDLHDSREANWARMV